MAVTSTNITVRNQAEWKALMNGIMLNFRAIKMAPHLAAEAERLQVLHAGYFQRLAGPDGNPWAINAPSTIKAKGHDRQLHGKIRTSTKARRNKLKAHLVVGVLPKRDSTGSFALRRSLESAFSEFSVRYQIDEWPRLAEIIHGTSAPYSIFNQEGTRTAPARPHVGINSNYLDGIQTRTADYVVGGLMR